jgi:hypothetical protein
VLLLLAAPMVQVAARVDGVYNAPLRTP